MIDANRLRVFRSVVASGTVSAAAASLGYTPSAVSQHLSALQRETGLTLFEKSGRGIVPTPQGRELAARSDDLMATMAHLDNVVADLRAGRTGSLAIGTFASAGEHWLPGITTAVLAEFPDTRLTIELTDPGIATQRLDIDIQTEDPTDAPAPPAGYDWIELTTEPYVALLPRTHRLAGRSEIAAKELADERWIRDDVAESACSRITARAWRTAGFAPQALVAAADHHGAIAFVAAGAGVCVMPSLPATHLPPEVVRVQVVDPTPTRRIAAHVHESARTNPAAVRFLELLTTAAHPSGSTLDQRG